MSLQNHSDFQEAIFKNLRFSPQFFSCGVRWEQKNHPETGYCTIYERPGLYRLTIADYWVPKTFLLHFQSRQPILRFGSFYEGKTLFQIDGSEHNSSLPGNFLVMEKTIKGTQFWKKGEHYQGIEFALSSAYMESLKNIDAQTVSLSDFLPNITQYLLPHPVSALLKQMSQLSASQELTPLLLEGFLLQCISLLTQAVQDGFFLSSVRKTSLFLGKKKLSFTTHDYQAIDKARQIIQEHPEKNITIARLSRQVFLNEQKLKAGFSLCYHTTIGAYLKECRMNCAAEMLVHTDMNIEEIAQASGYSSSASFINAFRQKYCTTPLQFRKMYA